MIIRAYMAHSIRGAKGKDATHADMEANNARAIKFAAWVRTAFPNLDIYCPGSHDLFVMLAYEAGFLTEKQILHIDKIILGNQDALIVYAPDGYLGGGVGIEIAEAQRLDKPIAFTRGSLDPIAWLLKEFVL